MGTATHPAFLRGAKTLLLLRLDGDRTFGIHEEQRHDHDGRAAFEVIHVNTLSPADRAGITPGDQLLTVQVLGVDSSPFAWSDSALERLELLEVICVVQLCVKKPDGHRITEPQQRRHEYMSQWLTTKMLKIASKRFRGAFILAQLQKVVVVLYDFEHDTFARLWKALNDDDRQAFTLPIARAFVSETKLPGLVDEPAIAASTRTPTEAASFKASDMSTTESQVWSFRTPSLSQGTGKSEPPSSPRTESDRATDNVSSMTSRPCASAQNHVHRYLPCAAKQRPSLHLSHYLREIMRRQQALAKERAAADTSDASEEEDEEEEWVLNAERPRRRPFGEQLLSVKVVGVDARAYAWSDDALDRIESLHEICVTEICIKKPNGTRITDAQLSPPRPDLALPVLNATVKTKAKVLDVSNKRVRGAYIPLQLKRAVVLIYDYEHAHFATLWKALPELDRAAITLPMARDFVSETRLPGLADDAETRVPTATLTPSLPATPEPTPPLSPIRTDADATESMVGSPRESVHSQEDTQSTSGGATTATTTGSSDSGILEIEEDTTPLSPPRQRPRLMTARTAARHSTGARRETSSARRRRRRLLEASDEDSDADADDVVFIKTELIQETATCGTTGEAETTRD